MKKMAFLLSACVFLLAGCSDTPTPSAVIEDLLDQGPDTCTVNIDGLQSGNRYTDLTAGEKVILRDPGGEHWRLEVYDLYSCEMKAAYQLPPNESPDFPYFLADLTYNNTERKVGIRGYREIFLVDLEQQSISQPILPEYQKSGRLADAESGVIQHLEVWEDYLVGTTQDWGPFVFRLDSLAPRAVLPAAELMEQENCHALFLIETASGRYQAILPQYDLNEGLFTINPLFAAPIAIQPEATVYAGGPYTRVKQPDGNYIGINLRTGELLPVIEEKNPN